MGDHNYVNNWPDHSKLLHPDTHLDGEGAGVRDGRKNRQINRGGGGGGKAGGGVEVRGRGGEMRYEKWR